ncbi:3-hydroxyacyl-CoA dehydrogenase [Brucella abortus]|uniref:3-hydroxyacyl-CoA dehydrogenase n=1 Tax=Brucella abortus TaxID=235 RepID=UPI0037328DEC
MERSINHIAIVGAGVMGTGIAQIAAQAGLVTQIFDAREGAAAASRDRLASTLAKLAEKGKISAEDAQTAVSRIEICSSIQELADCDLVVEAIVEKLDAKQALFLELEAVVSGNCILATNTSSLSVTSIARVCRHPERVAGFHFFNPVPLMKVVEVIDGLTTDPAVGDALLVLAKRMGHHGIRAKDMPGFIINHAGRAYGTEALKILGECVAPRGDIDRILRESAGFRMGPLELFDLTGLDVSHPVMESIYNQFYQEPRYSPSALTRQMLEGGYVGRKVGQGFYRYEDGKMVAPPVPQPVPAVDIMPSVWISADCDEDKEQLYALLRSLGATVETGALPSAEALCLLAPYGYDATTACELAGSDPARTVCIDMLPGLDRHRTLMMTPATSPAFRDAAHALLARDGVNVTVIRDSVGFVAQRTLAAIVNLACDIAQQGIATADDIDQAVRLGLGYPQGPFAWGGFSDPENIVAYAGINRRPPLQAKPMVAPQGRAGPFPALRGAGYRLEHFRAKSAKRLRGEISPLD